VALLSWKLVVVTDIDSPSSLLCFTVFFIPPINSVLASLQWLHGGVAGGGEEEDWWWYVEDAASVSLYFLLLHPTFCLCFFLFCFFYCSSFTLLSLFSLLSFLSFPLCSPLSFFFFSHPPLVHCLFWLL